ncbi:hypothetical protein [Komagataeibacter xylinus]|uniref:hypothetical protein n=1 Tax=Komagataeibacter xylinus TaxID=28448 RepID=UPI001F10D4A2|nr:hypothetical protein [Komagataeibacter xylinus]
MQDLAIASSYMMITGMQPLEQFMVILSGTRPLCSQGWNGRVCRDGRMAGQPIHHAGKRRAGPARRLQDILRDGMLTLAATIGTGP